MMSDEGKKGRRCDSSRPFLPALVILLLCLASCNLVIGLDREKLPDKVDEPCTTNEQCDDHHGCTQDVCQLPQGSCTHFLMTPGTVCREKPAENLCDVEEETCDGVGLDCPDDTLEPVTVQCRAAEGQCDEPESCDGELPTCPGNAFTDPGETCDDGDDCTHDDTCDGSGGCEGINGLHGAEDVSIGPWGYFACITLAGGDLSCWGNNNYGQMGDGTGEHRTVPVPIGGLPDGDPITQLASGGRHVNVLLTSGRIMAWGLGDTGQLGNGQDGADYQEITPVDVKWDPLDTTPALGWKQVSGGYLFNCAVQEDDHAWCWGKNDHGQLAADLALAWSNVPIEVTGLPAVASITSGNYHICVIDDAGSLWCWGMNNHGQLGNPAATDPNPMPIAVEGLPGRATDVACGVLHTCALLEDRSVWCWGTNEYGQLGNGLPDDSTSPVEVAALPSTVLDIDSEFEHTCALLEGGEMMCWGQNEDGQLGDGTSGDHKPQPVSVADLPSAVVVMAAGALHTCALLENTTVWCWGHNSFGELGIGTFDPSLEPLEVHCQ